MHELPQEFLDKMQELDMQENEIVRRLKFNFSLSALHSLPVSVCYVDVCCGLLVCCVRGAV